MNKTAVIVISSGAVLAAGLAFVSHRASQKIRPQTFIGPVAVGNMSREKALHTVDAWWTSQAQHELTFDSKLLDHPITLSAADMNVKVDATKTLHQAPQAGLIDLIRKPKVEKFAPVYQLDDASFQDVVARLNKNLKAPTHAKVFFIEGKLHRMRESGHAGVDLAKFKTRLMNSLSGHSTVEVPFVEAPKRVTDDQLASIHEVVSEFTTHFPTYKKSRCSNIQLASSKINGAVLLPGDRLSFNGTVGRRTPAAGFQIAGVFKNGKHDFDVGGGICQVSTTLYNAALLADLKIVHRYNHSMPVAYVPLGRDATVDYGALDLELENNTDKPIAVASEYHPGKLIFRILGTKQPGLDVKIESTGASSWSAGVQLVSDPTLAPGAKKVVDKGASGKQVTTYRNVYIDGKLVRRETLGTSTYKGGQKIIAVGPSLVNRPNPAMRLISDSH